MTEHVDKVLHGDSLEILRTMPAACVDAVVTDPPYGLAFMGKKWDYQVPAVELWREVLRVLKPGGHALVACGTRTQHRMAVNLEDSGFEIRDLIAWIYGNGFPKSMSANVAMDKFMAAEPLAADVYKVTAFLRDARIRAGWTNGRIDAIFGTNGMAGHWTSSASQPAVPSVREWEILKRELGFGDEMDDLVAKYGATERPEDWGSGVGEAGFLTALSDKRVGDPHRWGTALKPAMELWTLARKPLARKPLAGTVSANVQAYGTGALNIAGCRVAGDMAGAHYGGISATDSHKFAGLNGKEYATAPHQGGRWPANMIHDGSDEVLELLPAGAARFYYCAKASRAEREAGCEGLSSKNIAGKGNGLGRSCSTCGAPVIGGCSCENRTFVDPAQRNHHPTVKPLALMRWLVRLVTPPGGLVLDPFAGSGTTAMAAKAEGFRYLAIEREPDYVAIAQARIASIQVTRPLPLEVPA